MYKRPNNLSSRVIIITGTPGTGKTTIAKLLSKKINGIYINSGEFIQKGYFLGVDTKRDSLIADIDELRHIIDAKLLKIRTPAVIDSLIMDIVSPENILLVVVLTTVVEELRRRLKKKGFTTNKIMENIDAELCKICAQDAIDLCGLENLIEIDTTYDSPEDIVGIIYKEIKNRSGTIN